MMTENANSSKRPRGKKRSGGKRRRRPSKSSHHGGPRKKGGGNRSRKGGKGPVDKAVNQYNHLVEMYLQSRRKYFEMFYRVSEKEQKDLEGKFYRALEKLREYEKTLSPKAKEALEERNKHLRLDRTYSLNHELRPEGELAEEAELAQSEDPHYLETQKTSDFSDDTEESSGTIEDYKRLKGLP